MSCDLGRVPVQEDIHSSEGPSLQERHLHHWISTLLSGATTLSSLSIATDCVPWTPVLGHLPIRHLKLKMDWIKPWTDTIMIDSSFCSCLETLNIAEHLWVGDGSISRGLPDLFA